MAQGFLGGCVILGKLFAFSESQFLCKMKVLIVELRRGLNELVHTKYLV